MLLAGLVVAGAGAVLARSVGSLLPPLVFVAIGAPFIALALGNHGQLLFNTSSSAGKIFAGVFGGCFVIAGLIWGAFAAREITGVSGGSLFAGLLAAAVGVGGRLRDRRRRLQRHRQNDDAELSPGHARRDRPVRGSRKGARDLTLQEPRLESAPDQRAR